MTTVASNDSERFKTDLLTEKIIGCAIRVHQALGPGLLESAYKECLYFEMVNTGLVIEKEKELPLIYKNVKLRCVYRVDLMVEDQIIIEIKSVASLDDVHLAQLLSYLKLANRRFGLLLNFNVMKLKDGIRRVVNGY